MNVPRVGTECLVGFCSNRDDAKIGSGDVSETVRKLKRARSPPLSFIKGPSGLAPRPVMFVAAGRRIPRVMRVPGCRFRDGATEVVVTLRGQLAPELAGDVMPGFVAAGAVQDWMFDVWTKPSLLELHARVFMGSGRRGSGNEELAKRQLAEGLLAGRLVAVRISRPLAVVPYERPAPLGPEPEPMEIRTEVNVVLLDHAGRIASGVGCVLRAPDGKETEFAAGARFHLSDIDIGTCWARFPELGAPTGKPLQLEAPDDELVPAAIAIARSADPHDVGTGKAPTVFQLTRSPASVLELEHFSSDGNVFLAGAPPGELRPRAERLDGIDVIRVGLFEAALMPLAGMRLTGHGERGAARAKNVVAILTADRDAWAQSSLDGAGANDAAEILRWVARTTGWHCNPDENGAALSFFKDAYNHQLEVDGDTQTPKLTGPDVDLATWGAFFDMYARALWPKPPKQLACPYLIVNNHTQTYPVRLAEIGAGDANRYKEMNPLNPGRQIPGDRGWYAPQIGDKLFLPRDWDRNALRAKGYDVFDGEPDPPPIVPGPTPIAAPGPAVVACGDHHLTHPFEDAGRRRAKERRVELVAVAEDAPKICTGDGACDDTTCELYDPYRWKLGYVEPNPAALLGTSFLYGVKVGAEQQWSDAAVFRVVSEDGAQEQSFPLALGIPAGELRYFQLIGVLPRVRYRGELRDRDLLVDLFPFTELYRIQQPDDPYNVLPPPEPTPAAPEILPDPSPDGRLLRVRLFDRDQQPMRGCFYRLQLGGDTITGLSEDGFVGTVLPDVCPAQAILEWSDPEGSGTFEYRLDLALECDEGSEDVQIAGMLNNLGYDASNSLDVRVRAFQDANVLDEQGLDGAGRIPPKTRARIRATYTDRLGA